MKKLIQIVTLIVCLIPGLWLTAGQVRQLSWEDLIPEKLRSGGLFEGLNQDQRDKVIWVIKMLEVLPKRGPGADQYYKEVDDAMPSLKKDGIDIAEIMEKREALRTAVEEKLDGQMVRLPGYLLPLESSGENVTEFLLVPYVGACIHVPPPPPNQIVHVKVLQKGGYKNNQIYEPVWTTGKLFVKSLKKDLFLVDGSAAIDIGYTMQAQRIEPYKE